MPPDSPSILALEAASLEISSPLDGAIEAPGQTLNVTVSSPDNSTFVGVALIANRPDDPGLFGLTLFQHSSQ